MVAIRLQRKGTTKRPRYNVVALDHAKKRDGAYLEIIGDYSPREKDPTKRFFINKERFDMWVKQGASVSETVGQLVKATAKSV